MNKVYSSIISLLVTAQITAQNIAINTTGASANPSAMLDISSTSSGLLVPRMTSAQRTAIASPAIGLLVFDTSLSSFYFYNGTSWQIITGGASSGWGLTGNAGTVAGTNFIGTTDAVDFVTNTNNIERFRIRSNGNIGIGNSTPNAPLQFSNTVANRKIVFFEGTNNDHQFIGFGLNGSVLRYQLNQVSDAHVFFAGTSATTSSELFRIQGNGNVGIGNSSPNAPLQFSNTIANRKIVLYENSNNDHEFIGLGVNGSVFRYQVSSVFASHVFYAGNGASSSNEIMRIQGNGNVGIGTASPSANLEVNGSFRITNGTQGAGKILTSDASGFVTWANPSTTGILSGGTINYIPKWSSANSLSSTSMLFDNGGAVGVGTNNPLATLDVAGTLRVGSDAWHTSSDGFLRTYYASAGTTYLSSPNGYEYRNSAANPILSISDLGSLKLANDIAHTSFDGLYRTFYSANGRTFFGTGDGYAFDNSTFTKIVTFKDNGDVGIGTETPAAKLEVAGSLRIGSDVWHTSADGQLRTYYASNGTSYYGSPLGHGFGNSANLTVFSIADNGGLSVSNDVQHTSYDGISRNYYATNGTSFFGTGNGYGFYNSANSNIFNINNNGSLGLSNDVWHISLGDNWGRLAFNTNGTTYFGSPNNTYIFQNSGSVDIAGIYNGAFYAWSYNLYSDQRLKKDITPLSNALSNVLQMQAFNYLYKQDILPKTKLDDKPQIGFIAQDVEKIFPSMVTTNADGYKAIDYSKITPVLVEAIKEQQKMIEDLKKEMQDLKTNFNSLKEK